MGIDTLLHSMPANYRLHLPNLLLHISTKISIPYFNCENIFLFSYYLRNRGFTDKLLNFILITANKTSSVNICRLKHGPNPYSQSILFNVIEKCLKLYNN